MKNVFLISILFFWTSNLLANTVPISGNWAVNGEVIDLKINEKVELHSNSYFWVDAHINGSEFIFNKDNSIIYTSNGEKKSARYEIKGDTLTFFFMNKDKKESYTEFDLIKINSHTFKLVHTDSFFRTTISFSK